MTGVQTCALPISAKKLIEIFDFMDDMNKHGFKEAKKKWNHIFTEYQKSTKQQTLFE